MSGKAVDVTSENNRHSKVHYFDFLVSTFNPLSLSLKWVMTLVETTYREKRREKSCKITNMIRVKGLERRPFIFISRLNTVQRDSHKADEIVMEIEEWKQKVADDYIKSFSRVWLGVLETSILSYCIIWIETVLYEFSLCCSSFIIVSSWI